MTEKEILYIEDAVNHEIYTIETCVEIIDCLEDENLIKLVKKILKKHKTILEMLMEVL